MVHLVFSKQFDFDTLFTGISICFMILYSHGDNEFGFIDKLILAVSE